MRALLWILVLALAFTAAWAWQERHLERLRAQRGAAAEVAEGRLGETESGLLPEGWAVVTIGAPSGANPIPRPEPVEPSDARDEPAPSAEPEPWAPEELADFELTVQPGQTLSGIAQARYGTAGRRVVQALAEYNGLADPDSLRAGARLRLPPAELLLE